MKLTLKEFADACLMIDRHMVYTQGHWLSESDFRKLKRLKSSKRKMSNLNYNLWNHYFRDIPSPQNFIDFAYYYLISAALQRRVWLGSLHRPLFANTYSFLVGDPGVGKGLVIQPTVQMLKHFMIDRSTGKITELEDNQVVDDTTMLPLFPAAPDSTTYEALVNKLARCGRSIQYDKDKFGGSGIYMHNSMFFALEEISSLFKKNTENIVNFLLSGYDCGDYRRETKTQGIDQIKKCCISFFGGTTPSFMETTFNDKLLNEGFSSRCWFIYEFCNRFRKWNFSDPDDSQIQARKDILAHVKKLSLLYGPCKFTVEADDFMSKWWLEEEQTTRANTNLKLLAYYARKNIHVKKLAMILHFSEPGFETMEISTESCVRALRILSDIERRMHHALTFGKNPLAAIGSKVMKWMLINKRPATKVQLLEEFIQDARENELDEVLKHLVSTGKIASSNGFVYTLAGKYAIIGNPKSTGQDIVAALDSLDNKESIPGEDLKALPL